MDEILNCFRILDLELGATPKAVKRAYRNLVKKWHPDQFTDDAQQRREAEEKLKDINLAFERIQDYYATCPLPFPKKKPQPNRKSTPRSAPQAANRPPTPRSTRPFSPSASDPGPESVREPRDTPKTATAQNHASSVWRARCLSPIAVAAAASIAVLLLILATVSRYGPDRRLSPVRSASVVEGAPVESRDRGRGGSAGVRDKPGSIPLGIHGPNAFPEGKAALREGSGLGSSAAQPDDRQVKAPLGPLGRVGPDSPAPSQPSGEGSVQSNLGFLADHSESIIAAQTKRLEELPPIQNAPLLGSDREQENSLAQIAASLKAKLSEKMLDPARPSNDRDKEEASAQFQRGLRYAQGEGVPQDYAEAAKWYRHAADAGHAGAQKNLGFLYASGKGVPQDYDEAQRWFGQAAAQGNVGADWANAVVSLAKTNAQQDLVRGGKGVKKVGDKPGKEDPEVEFQRGLRYANSAGVTQNYAEAAKWYRRAAEAGHAGAQKNLGFLYASGKGVPLDNAEAEKWFSKAAAQGNLGAGLANAIMSLTKTERGSDSDHLQNKDETPAATNEVQR